MGEEKELYPGHAADLARRARRTAATERANIEPLPGPLTEAFDPEPIRVGAYTVRPFVPFDAVVLRKINSPLFRQALEARKPVTERVNTEFDDDEEFEMIYQFIVPIEQVRADLAAGREHFRDQARAAVAYNPRISAVDYAGLLQAVERNFMRAFATALEFEAKPSGTGDGPIFSAPPAGPMTGSAGG